ncbi:hypothetical protein GWI33_017217 [Rhynchophorus ferrugineus]|uniref:NADPH-dependent diflavin oxidoreductase 1 n=1 Tax=Rhynchophorus ferrugineus TaxID=354439 RepID=A0A834M6E8_RHYFE|nr:hypothetical protein GWI33_017217 [Rhynchophorus ferrugineus]
MSFQNKTISILYGSQTGNAQDLAERIWRESKRFYFQSRVGTLDDYDVAHITEANCLIIVCSTTGQGEEPDNMKKFWKFLLRKSLPTNLLRDVRVAVLGLGDSSYVKFNFAAKRLQKRLINLGAEPLIPIGLGDDQHDLGYDAAADPWIDNLWSKLLEVYPLPKNVTPLSRNLPIIPRWNIVSNSPLLENSNRINKVPSIYYSTRTSTQFYTTVLTNTRITDADHFQDVRLIKLQTDHQEYSPGDLLVLRPKNLQWKIEEFKEILKDNGVVIPDETVINLIENDQNVPVPEVLKAEEERFSEFTTAEGQQEMYSYTNRPRRNIVEVLGDFPHATKNLTLQTLLEIIPAIKPREFSIASSFKVHKDEVHLLVAVVKFKTNLHKERFGLCSNFLAELAPGEKILAWLKPGCFKFPKDLNVPVIMVGPGTGVAPFRNFIYEMSGTNRNPENIILLYGCRYKSRDCLVTDDVDKLHQEKKITLICAYSREQDHKVYVQDKIVEHQELIWSALEKKAYIFVAGNSKNMPQAVRDAFINVCETCGKLSQDEAVMYIDKMEKQGRYQTECWS